MTQLICLTTTISILFTLLNYSDKLVKYNSSNNLYDMLAWPLNFLSPISTSFHFFSFIITVSFLIYTLFNYRKIHSRVISFLLYFFSISLMMSNGKIDHDLHGFIFMGFFMCFYKTDKPLAEQWNLNVLRLTQSTLLFHYFLAGTWKFRRLITSGSIDLNELAISPIAVGIAEGSLRNNFLFEVLIENTNLLKLGFILVLLFQISCIYPIIKKNYYQYWAIAALLFHISTELSTGIRFNNTRYAILIALILFDEFLKLEKRINKRGYRASLSKKY